MFLIFACVILNPLFKIKTICNCIRILYNCNRILNIRLKEKILQAILSLLLFIILAFIWVLRILFIFFLVFAWKIFGKFLISSDDTLVDNFKRNESVVIVSSIFLNNLLSHFKWRFGILIDKLKRFRVWVAIFEMAICTINFLNEFSFYNVSFIDLQEPIHISV